MLVLERVMEKGGLGLCGERLPRNSDFEMVKCFAFSQLTLAVITWG